MRRIAVLCFVSMALLAASATARPVDYAGPAGSSVRAHMAKKPKATKHKATKHRATKKPRSGTTTHATRATAAGASTTAGSVILGTQKIEPIVDENGAGLAEAYPFTATASGSVSSITVYVDSHNHATTMIAGLYTNLNGAPGSLLASGSLASPKAGAWNTVAVDGTPVTSGSTYWLAIVGQGGGLFFRDANSTTCYGENSAQSKLRALPSSWSAGHLWNDCPVSAYASGTLALAPSAPPTDPPPLPLPPVNTGAPAISGNPVQGQTLTTDSGSWLNSPTSYTYQWEDCDSSGNNCLAITGATSSSYTLASSDVGDTIRSVVSASNSGGSSLLPGTSAPTAVVTSPPVPVASFTYSPTSPVTGQTVTFDGTGSSCAATPCAYNWTTPGGSLGSGQTLSHAFGTAGTQQVTLTVTDALGRSAGVEHNVTVTQVAPSNTALPTITGTAQQGQALSASRGSWTASPTSYAYQWRDCNSSGVSCSNIAGATSSSYTLAASDVASTIDVVVTATNAAGSTPATSAPTAAVSSSTPVAPSNMSPPTISGTAQQGQTLTASSGTWSGSPTSYGYQWLDCNSSGAGCSNIAGATATSYSLAAGDVGSTMRVVVTAANSGGSTPATSAATSQITSSGGGGGGGTTCTATVSSVSNINSQLTPGAVVCLAGGSYGGVSLTATPSSNATLTAVPGAHVVVSSVSMSGATNVTVTQLHITNGLTAIAGQNDVIDHNDITNAGCGYGVFIGGTQSGNTFTAPGTTDVVSWNMIHDTGSSCEADAIRIQGFRNLTIVGNDVYNIEDPSSACGGACHTDTLQSYQAGIATSGLTITKNYVHDTCGAQGFPFLKDGDISGVSITDNLSSRMAGGGSCSSVNTGISVAENTPTLVIQNNTNMQGGYVQAYGSAPNPSAVINHNVFSSFNVMTNTSPYKYSYTENYDVFTGPSGDTWSLNRGPNDSFNSSPGYKCGSSCGTGTAAGDDYELASNPNGIGIDWSPANQQYGPSS